MSIYFIRCTATGSIKIGLSANPWKRLSKMQSDSPGVLEMLGAEPGGADREAELHQRFAKDRLRGEWFRPSDEIVTYARALKAPATGSPRKIYDVRTSPTRLGAAVGIGKGYASTILSGKREPGFSLAVRIFVAAGMKLGCMARLTDEEAVAVSQMKFA